MEWLIIFLALVLIFILLIVMRTLAFKAPAAKLVEASEVEIDKDQAIARFVELLRCKTVSSHDESLVDKNEFVKFEKALADLYPQVHHHCKLEKIGPSGLLFHYKGKSAEAPIVLMAHYDVVPAQEDAWEKPPFSGVIENGVLWGRGSLDTKGTLFGIMETAESLIKIGFVPENDIYLAFSGDEEIAGDSAPAMVSEFEKRGIRPAMVIDEGGAVVQDIFPGVASACALIGTAEKGMLDVELSLLSKGGHAATPPPQSLIGTLSQAVLKIEKQPFKLKLTPPVAAMFDTLGRHSSFVYRMIFANLWCFLPLLDFLCRKQGGELNAMLRTTCAFTMMEGSNATNVLPPVVKVRANLRLIGGDTPQTAIAYLSKLAANPEIKFTDIYSMNPSRNSVSSGKHWEILESAIKQTWPDTLVSPYLMFACSDSRHYCRISDGVFRFSAMTLNKEERALLHSHNERISVENAIKIIQFYSRLMKQC